jgi:hypothetical protein
MYEWIYKLICTYISIVYYICIYVYIWFSDINGWKQSTTSLYNVKLHMYLCVFVSMYIWICMYNIHVYMYIYDFLISMVENNPQLACIMWSYICIYVYLLVCIYEYVCIIYMYICIYMIFWYQWLKTIHS